MTETSATTQTRECDNCGEVHAYEIVETDYKRQIVFVQCEGCEDIAQAAL